MIRLEYSTVWAMRLHTVTAQKILSFARECSDGVVWYGRGALWCTHPTGWTLLAEVGS